MIITIVIEVVLAILLLTASASFWACIKSPKFLGHVLSEYGELKKFLNFLDKDTIHRESQDIQPVLGSYSNNIATWMKASFYALDKARNMTALVSAAIIIVSYFLGLEFLLINVALFFLVSLAPIPASAQKNMFSDLHIMIVTIYKWNSVDPEQCRQFCTTEQPRMLKNIYCLVTELNSNKV